MEDIQGNSVSSSSQSRLIESQIYLVTMLLYPACQYFHSGPLCFASFSHVFSLGACDTADCDATPGVTLSVTLTGDRGRGRELTRALPVPH